MSKLTELFVILALFLLCDLLNHLPEKSLRRQKVAKALMDFTYTADFELPAGEKRNASFRKAREVLGWAATRTLEALCRDAWNWQKNNPKGYSE